MTRLITVSACGLLLSACASAPPPAALPAADANAGFELVAGPSLSEHRGDDDLLSGGLGLAGLQSPQPPALAAADRASAGELRRRALWANWRGIADLSPQGFGVAYGAVPAVPGRELHALLRLPQARQPFRVMLQLPDSFDPAQPCVVVSASSGSRGIYGAIALAGGWGLPKGCAVAYTDKGAGSDWIAAPDSRSAGLSGLPAQADEPAAFALDTAPTGLAFRHAHSGDNPEAHWGEHVRAAAQWSLRQLDGLFPQHAPFARAQTRLIAVGVSNGGGAVLQAAGLGDFGLDGVVALSPNVLPGEGGRPLYDYASEAAQWMPCALGAAELAEVPALLAPAATAAACAALAAEQGWAPGDAAAHATAALQHLRQQGWTDAALRAGALSAGFDLWRAVAAAYASAYTRRSADDMACGYRYAAVDANGQPRSAPALERQLWWSDSSGIPPLAGVALLDPAAGRAAGLACLRALWTGDDALARRLREGVEATRAGRPPAALPIHLLHGLDDGLVPAAFSSIAYANWVLQQPNSLQVRWIDGAQHFDAFVALPALQGRYRALLPEAYRALDELYRSLPTR